MFLADNRNGGRLQLNATRSTTTTTAPPKHIKQCRCINIVHIVCFSTFGLQLALSYILSLIQ